MGKFLLLTASVVVSAWLAFSAFGETYQVDYGGRKDVFLQAKDRYRAGETVELRLYFATDTDYTVKVDGREIFPRVSDTEGQLIYSFVMPDHDVTLEYSHENAMVCLVSPTPAEIDTEKTLLFDYYSAPAAVVGDAEYHEMTLNRGSDGLLYLNTYSGSSTYGTTTSHEAYPVPDALLDEALNVVEKYGMANWNDQAGVGLCGAILVVKFPDEYGNLMRVSTEHMPDDGQKAFGEIAGVLGGALPENGDVITEDKE